MVKNETTQNKSPSYIVGIGASAGGLEAIEDLIRNTSNPSGMAYVIVQHLSPDYKSLMDELLSKFTVLPINKIEDGMLVEPDNIYLIPPNKNITIFHGRIISVDREDRSRGQINLPINTFFNSLAQDQGEKAIGVVLSGTGSDGTRGVRAIKESGGMTIAQLPDSAKFDSMPKNAISTGLIDFILTPKEISKQLAKFAKHPFAKFPSAETIIQESDNGLSRIFSLLREHHRVDFTHYKPSTIIRRIERRITINQCQNIEEYNELLTQKPYEITTLFQELLIGVTSFFRDEKVYAFVKEEIIPYLMNGAPKEAEEIRVWVAGCSTGEEAYSMSMLLHSYLEASNIKLKVKIFATDLDSIAIEKASVGTYPQSISADVPPELLSKFFIVKDDYYQISRGIRESVVFAQHDLLKDPPFTNIDLISCRNLLIYLQPVLQKKVLESFNFSLKNTGALVLGSSETLGEMDEFFEPINAKLKIFKSKGKSKPLSTVRPTPIKSWSSMSPALARAHQDNESLARLTEERFFNRFIEALSNYDIIPLTLVADGKSNVSHIYGDATEFLRYTHGKVVTDISKIVTNELSIPVSTGLKKVIKTNQQVNLTNIKVHHAEGGDGPQTVEIRIFPMGVRASQEPLYCVLIRENSKSVFVPNLEGVVSYNVGLDAEQRISDLEQELQFSRESLQATVEELETSNEELQATNEELLASNEELQSTNEELQSVNEELYTVNAEYQTKITELTILNTDMDNLFDSTQTAALFLDENMEIRRFTPKLSNVLNILHADIGRPISHLSANLSDDLDLIKVVRRVMIDGIPEEYEFQGQDTKWHLLRVSPYAVTKNVTSGIVLTIIEIDVLKRAQSQLLEKTRTEAERLAQIVESSGDAFVQYRPDGRILTWSVGAEKMYGWNKKQASKMTIYEMTEKSETKRLKQLFENMVENHEKQLETFSKLTATGNKLMIEMQISAMRDVEGGLVITVKEQSVSSEQVSV